MKSDSIKTGIWIDRNRSVIVSLEGDEAVIRVINSDMEKNVRFTRGAFKETEEDIRNRRIRNQFHVYLENVAGKLRDTDYLLVMGPGNAKIELGKHLIKSRFRGHIISIETADKMTERQLAAKVRARFMQKETALVL
ncbi:MAG: hypothetical protein ACM3S2_10510 [Ignavibacteriales bacterium]